MDTTAPSITSGIEATRRAEANTMLSPRFYTTDFEAMNRMDVTPVRAEWDRLMAEFESDGNIDHFRRTPEFVSEIRELPEALQREFIDFLITSVTSEFSGCVLYKEIEKHVDNPDIKRLMGYMARDESRHAGFINQSLKDYGIAVDLGFLKREKKYTYFRPKFILYATYLSEKIGYARYISIFRQLEKHPEHRFHPIFKWFQRWCNDEFRHGESLALLMRADPKLLTGVNRLWIRFFLLAVYATMYVRDHTRPELHHALGLDSTQYDMQVLRITSEISRQIFPFELSIDDPRFRAGLERLCRIGQASDRAKARGGLIGGLQRGALAVAGLATFARLYLLPVRPNTLPDRVLMAPAW
ncbi:MAG: magnesium-protoporphyrin IX monomethyl ester (oxidative) cyclase [Pseudomonadota bacterium]|jgi:magnesium-protoporphyrin IX monomethyl ester (oxidative) cyclase